jgi:hypothetical protein
VDVLPDSHKLLVTPYLEFERQFGGKTVLAGLRLNKTEKALTNSFDTGNNEKNCRPTAGFKMLANLPAYGRL